MGCFFFFFSPCARACSLEVNDADGSKTSIYLVMEQPKLPLSNLSYLLKNSLKKHSAPLPITTSNRKIKRSAGVCLCCWSQASRLTDWSGKKNVFGTTTKSCFGLRKKHLRFQCLVPKFTQTHLVKSINSCFFTYFVFFWCGWEFDLMRPCVSPVRSRPTSSSTWPLWVTLCPSPRCSSLWPSSSTSGNQFPKRHNQATINKQHSTNSMPAQPQQLGLIWLSAAVISKAGSIVGGMKRLRLIKIRLIKFN